MKCNCPEEPDMYRGGICECDTCEDTLISEEKMNKRVCRRCNCDRQP